MVMLLQRQQERMLLLSNSRSLAACCRCPRRSTGWSTRNIRPKITRTRAGKDAPPSVAEGNAQVRRLITRDRQTFLGNEEDILDKYEQEFGEGSAGSAEGSSSSSNSSSSSSQNSTSSSKGGGSTVQEFKTAADATSGANKTAAFPPSQPPPDNGSRAQSANGAAASPERFFKSASPFGASASPFDDKAPQKRRSSMEPKGLTPDMSPDPEQIEAPPGFLKNIRLGQVVLFFTFSSMIALMIGTFTIVVKAGAVRLAGLE